MKNPFADPENEIDYNKKGRDIPLFIPTLDDVIDLQPALNGKKMSQKDWILFYNKQEGEAKGKRMILASDIYNAGKSGSEELLASLRKDLDASNILSATRNFYNTKNLAGKVVHNFNSTVAKPIEFAVTEIPIYQSTLIKDVVGDDEHPGKGLAYVQVLFNTNDTASRIIKTLEKLSQKKAEGIRFSTPDQNSRKHRSERAVRFYYAGAFRVDGDGFGFGDELSCRSRGVLLK